MKFSIAINMVRRDATFAPRDVWQHSLDMLRIAEEGGMYTAWAAEHHGLEFWYAANPFTILTDWAARTSRIRLGVGVVVAPYWHPIRVAGEAGPGRLVLRRPARARSRPRRLHLRAGAHGRWSDALSRPDRVFSR